MTASWHAAAAIVGLSEIAAVWSGDRDGTHRQSALTQVGQAGWKRRTRRTHGLITEVEANGRKLDHGACAGKIHAARAADCIVGNEEPSLLRPWRSGLVAALAAVTLDA